MKEYHREVQGPVDQTQGFPFQMKQEVNGLLQAETIWARRAHFSTTGVNLTARLCLVAAD